MVVNWWPKVRIVGTSSDKIVPVCLLWRPALLRVDLQHPAQELQKAHPTVFLFLERPL